MAEREPRDEPGQKPVVQDEPGSGGNLPPAPPAPTPKPPTPAPAARPVPEVKTRKLPASFYVGMGLATVGVVVMMWAAWRRDP